jgi:hypothetical protein
MASIRKEISIAVAPSDAWAALRAFGDLHRCLVPGFAVDARLEGRDRIVTFFNGTVLRERLIDLDEDARRLVWSIVDGMYTHHNASVQVFADGGGTVLVWIADLLPDEAAERTAGMMGRALATIKQTLERHNAEPTGTGPDREAPPRRS